MKLIACVDPNWAIGQDNKLLFRIPEDLKLFRIRTEGNVVIYGRKTLETFPNQRPLAKRLNIIMSSTTPPNTIGSVIVHSLDELKTILRYIGNEADIYVIGGEQIYNLLLPLCTEAYITKVDIVVPEANKFCPNLDKDPDWHITDSKKGEICTFYKYERIE